MARIFEFQLCFYIVFWTFGHDFSAWASSENSHCSRVKHQFVHQRIGSSDLIPETPVHDPGVSICFDALQEPNRRSCCTAESEARYMIAVEKMLRDSIRSQNAYLKKQLMGHMTQYQDTLLGIVNHEAERTKQKLTDNFKIPWGEQHEAVHDLFQDLTHYIKRKHVSLYGTVSTFFDEIFPAVFKLIMNDPPEESYSDEYRDCLIKKRKEVYPAPFGYIPQNISRDLNKALSTGKAYVEALEVIIEAINTTDHTVLDEKCREDTVRLQFCSQCRGFVDVMPCKELCLNVLHGCLAKLSVIDPEWDAVIVTMKQLVRHLSGPRGVEGVLRLENRITDAILHAMDKGPHFYKSVEKLCQKPIVAGANKKDTIFNKKIFDGTESGRLPPANLDLQIKIISKELSDSQGLFSSFPLNMCSQSYFAEQKLGSTQCWNGTDVGRYSKEVLSRREHIHSQHNIDLKLLNLKEKLAHLKINLHTKFEGLTDRMMSDFTVEAGSGGVYSVVTDDEDMMGSGSGEGSGTDSDFVTVDESDDEDLTKTVEGNDNEDLRPDDLNNPDSGSSMKYLSTSLIILVFTQIVLILS